MNPCLPEKPTEVAPSAIACPSRDTTMLTVWVRRTPHHAFYQGVLLGCFASFPFAYCSCLFIVCFRPLSLSFLPWSPIAYLLSPLALIYLKAFAQEDLIFLPFHLVSSSLCGQNGHSPVSRTSSMSTTPSESFRQFKVSVTTKYGQLPSQGIPERSLTSLWKAFIPISSCSSDPFVNFIPYRHARFEPFPS